MVLKQLTVSLEMIQGPKFPSTIVGGDEDGTQRHVIVTHADAIMQEDQTRQNRVYAWIVKINRDMPNVPRMQSPLFKRGWVRP